MNILIVAGGFFPAKNYGGPVISIDNLCSLLHEDISFYIIASDHENGDTKRLIGISHGWNNRSNSKVIYLPDNELKRSRFIEIIEEVNPDWIYINSLFSISYVIPFLKLAKRNSIPVLLAPRGQLCKNAFKKKYKKIPYLILYRKLFQSENIRYQYTSNEEKDTIKKYLNILNDNLYYLENISFAETKYFKKQYKSPGKLRIIFLSRIHPKKNLIGAIRILANLTGDVVFDIYGPKEDRTYWNECEIAIKKLPNNIRVNYCGIIEHDDVYKVFAAHDVFLFPTLSENYGHVIAEAMLSKCPVIISDQTPWTPITEYNAGFAYGLSDLNSFVHTLQSIMDMDNDQYTNLCNNSYTYVKNVINIQKLKTGYKKFFFKEKD